LSHMTRSAQPTQFHHMLATLAEEGRLMRLYTQNVDGIDTAMDPLATTVPLKSKGPWPRTIQLHGGLEKMVCTKCGVLSPFDGALFEGPEPPPCKSCEELENIRVNLAGKRGHGIGRLRPRMVLYNEFNPDEEAIGAVTAADLKSRPDAVIVVGTSLKVPGVRRIVREMTWVARGKRDGFAAWINSGPEAQGVDLKGCWDLVVRGDCDEVARLAALPRWNDKDTGLYAETTREKVDQLKKETMLEVVVDIKHKAVENVQGIITPGASPRRQSPAPLTTAPKIALKGTQSKLVFTTTEKEERPSKKISANTATQPKQRGRPKKATAAPSKPTQTITKSFTVTKGPTVAVKAEKPLAPGSEAISLNLSKTAEPMQPVSPTECRNNSDVLDSAQVPVDEDDLIKKQLLGGSSLLSTTPKMPMNLYNAPWGSQTPQPSARTEVYNSNESSPLSQCATEEEEEALQKKWANGASALIDQYGQQKRRETISPTSKPTNMAHLMD
jgi:NAD-dependent histone deacetylase SIR2